MSRSSCPPTWAEHLDRLEEWLRRAEDPTARPPVAQPEGQPAGTDLLRARTLLAAMAEREVAVRRLRDDVGRAEAYSRA